MVPVDEVTQLALAARAGDRIALAAFIRSTQPAVWRLCAHLVTRHRADDLTQETYLRAIPALTGYRGEASARTWLLSIARRVAAEDIRRTRRSRRLLGSLTAGPFASEPGPSTPVDLLLRSLDADRRTAFVLTQLLGLTYAEAAAVCGCPVGTIRSRVARARDQLLGELGAEAVE